MSTTKPSTRKRRSDSEVLKSEQTKREEDDMPAPFLDFDFKDFTMSTTKPSTGKRRWDSEVPKSEQRKQDEDDLSDADLSSGLKGIMSALHQIREKVQKDGQKKNAETISSVASEIKSKLDELKSKVEKERQSFAKALSKSSKECENSLKNETAKFQALYEKFCKERVAHLQAFKETISKFEEEKERLFIRYEQQSEQQDSSSHPLKQNSTKIVELISGKREKSMLSEHEKACADKIAQLESSLKKKKNDDKTFSILRKSLGSFLDNASDEDFPPDD